MDIKKELTDTIAKKVPSLVKVALSQKVEVNFPNCPKGVPKKLSWDLKNENADFFCIYRFNQLIDNASRTYL